MMRATMSLAPPARNETIKCTGRDGYVSVRAADVTAGSMATLAAEVRNLRRGNFMVMLRELEHLSSAVNLTLRAPQMSGTKRTLGGDRRHGCRGKHGNQDQRN